MKDSIHKIQHKANKALRHSIVNSQLKLAHKSITNYNLDIYRDKYYNNIFCSRPAVHKAALEQYVKELKRNKKIQTQTHKKHSKRSSSGEILDEHPFVKMGHNPDHYIKQKQTMINEKSHIDDIRSRKWC